MHQSRQLTALYGLVAAVAHPLSAAGRFYPPGYAAAVPASTFRPHASKRLVALSCQAGLRACAVGAAADSPAAGGPYAVESAAARMQSLPGKAQG